MSDSKYIVLSAWSENHDFSVTIPITEELKSLISKRMAIASTLKVQEKSFSSLVYSFSDLSIFEDAYINDAHVRNKVSYITELPEYRLVENCESVMVVWPDGVSIRFWIDYDEETFETQLFDLGYLS